jgi:hypothetical protein
MWTPPTDSLYKFMAIFGLVALAWSLTFPAQKQAEYHVLELELDAELKTVAEVSENLKAQYKAIVTKQGTLDPNSAEWRDLEVEKRDKHIALLKASEPTAAKQGRLGALQDNANKFSLLERAGYVVGIVLSMLGFALWYLRIQRHLDAKAAKGKD